MVLRDLDDARAMTDADLRDVLARSTDARSRVIAVWALAMRLAPPALFAELLQAERQPGVRRTLAVVLAGLGQTELLAAIGELDPDVHVRAHAMQLAVRFARAGAVPWEVVLERLRDAAEVRAAIVGQLDAGDPPTCVDAVLALIGDADPAVRREALDAAVRFHVGGMLDATSMRAVLSSVSLVDARNALTTWFERAPASAIADTVAPVPRVRQLALELHPELATTELLPLLAEDPSYAYWLVRNLHVPLSALPPALVVRLFLAQPYAYVALEVVGFLSALESAPPDAMPALREAAEVCRNALRGIAELPDDPDALDELGYHEPEWLAEEQSTLEDLLEQAVRLGGDSGAASPV